MYLQHFGGRGMILFLDRLEFSPALRPPPSHGGWVVRRSQVPSNVSVLAPLKAQGLAAHSSLLCSLWSSHPRLEVGMGKPPWITQERRQLLYILNREAGGRRRERKGGAGCHSTRADLNAPRGYRALNRAGDPVLRPSSVVTPDAQARYLFEAGPAAAEAQAGTGVDLDHHLPILLGLGSVVEPAPHRMAPIGRWALGGRILWPGAQQSHILPLHPHPRSRQTSLQTHL